MIRLGIAAGRIAGAIGFVFTAIGQLVAPLLRAVFGVWTPPAWAQLAGRGLEAGGGFVRRHALASTVVVALAAVLAWQAPHIALRWRAWAPAWMNVGLVADAKGVAAVSATSVSRPYSRDSSDPEPANVVPGPGVSAKKQLEDAALLIRVARQDAILRLAVSGLCGLEGREQLALCRRVVQGLVLLEQRRAVVAAGENRLAELLSGRRVGLQRVFLGQRVVGDTIHQNLLAEIQARQRALIDLAGHPLDREQTCVSHGRHRCHERQHEGEADDDPPSNRPEHLEHCLGNRSSAPAP